MDYKKDLEELEKRIDENTNKIISNFEQINNNTNKIQKNSYALDILKDYKAETKRLYTILIIILFMLFITIGFLIFIKL